MKKLIIVPILLTLTASTNNIEKQCPFDKNYMKSNPTAMEEYKQLKKEGKIKSFYYESPLQRPCNYLGCVSFDPKQYDFIEKKFNDKFRQGIYTIYATKDTTRTDCFKELFSHKLVDKNGYCYYAVKNEDGVIKSRYHRYLKDLGTSVLSGFYDAEKNISLFEHSYTVYSTGALGGPGFGTCGSSNNNYPDYRFNTLDYP